jgi:hypothetical protein
MTGKGLPKGDHKDYSHIFMRFLPIHFHDEPIKKAFMNGMGLFFSAKPFLGYSL